MTLVEGVESWYEYADIGTFQLHLSPDRLGFQYYTFMTKLVKDLSGLDYIIPLPHDCDSGYPSGAYEPDEIRELFSQILRGGGTGFHFWPASWGGRRPTPPTAASVEAGYPEAWESLLKAARLVKDMPLLKFPKSADSAIFLSDETAKCGVKNSRSLYAFYLLGPEARAWFKFISGTLVELGRADLSSYKIIYLPSIKYSDKETAEALIHYTEEGGTVICGDPLAFEHDITSEPLNRMREKLFGVKSKPRR